MWCSPSVHNSGYTVVAVGSVGDAMDRFKELTPDLLMTGNYVEGMPGHDAAVYLRTKSAGMRVLIVGGLLADERIQYREALQGFEVFPKPYTRGELLDKVKDVLSKPRGEFRGSS
jgi:DNA-binding response OmpR family regulator